MAGNRTLKLSILADVDNLNKNLKSGGTNVDSFGKKLADFGKKAALAFAAAAAAAGAYALKIGVEGVKAAIEDQKSQESLRKTLQNVTGATDAAVASTEAYIAKTEIAAAVADTDLRASLDRLLRATGDVTKAQKLQTIALDVAAGSGKSLSAVTEALSKAQEGNLGGLTRLGVGLTAAEVKTLSFEQITEKLAATFAGQSAASVNTFQGRLDRLNIVIDNAKETIGFALLPILERLLNFVNERIIPVIQKFADGFGGGDGLAGNIDHIVKTIRTVLEPVFNGLISLFNRVRNAIVANQDNFRAFADLIQKYVAPVIGTVLGGALRGLGVIADGVIRIIGAVVGIITKTVETAIAGINALIRAYNKVPLLPNIPTINTGSISTPNQPNLPNLASLPTGVAGSVSAPTAQAQPTVTNNITVNGAIDSESTARQIAKVLTESAARGTGGGGSGLYGGLLVT